MRSLRIRKELLMQWMIKTLIKALDIPSFHSKYVDLRLEREPKIVIIGLQSCSFSSVLKF